MQITDPFNRFNVGVTTATCGSWYRYTNIIQLPMDQGQWSMVKYQVSSKSSMKNVTVFKHYDPGSNLCG